MNSIDSKNLRACLGVIARLAENEAGLVYSGPWQQASSGIASLIKMADAGYDLPPIIPNSKRPPHQRLTQNKRKMR